MLSPVDKNENKQEINKVYCKKWACLRCYVSESLSLTAFPFLLCFCLLLICRLLHSRLDALYSFLHPHSLLFLVILHSFVLLHLPYLMVVIFLLRFRRCVFWNYVSLVTRRNFPWWHYNIVLMFVTMNFKFENRKASVKMFRPLKTQNTSRQQKCTIIFHAFHSL